MPKYFVFMAGIILLVLLSACNGLAGEPVIVATVVPLPTLDPAHSDNLGGAIFEARCSSCHGISGRGDGTVALEAGLDTPDFTLQETSADQSLLEWTNTIRFGRIESMMPPWENSLSDEEIEAVAEYTFTLWQSYEQTDREPLNIISEPEIITETLGSIIGEITQGTTDAILPDVISVALQVIDTEGNEAHFEMQVLDETMTYVFEDVLITRDHTYFVTAIHNDMVFYSDIRFGTPNNPQMSLPVSIYEMTSDESVIEIDMFLMRLIPDAEGVIVQQLVNFKNISDRVYRGENQLDGFTYDSVRLPLPDQAQILNQVELVPRFLMLEGEAQQTLLDTQPVLPNTEHLVEVVYMLPLSITQPRQSLDLPIRYPVTNSIELMTQPSQFRIVSDDFESTGAQHFSVGVYESYLSDPLAGNTIVQFDIRVAPSTSEEADNLQSKNRGALMLIGGVALMLLSGLALLASHFDTTPSNDFDDPASD